MANLKAVLDIDKKEIFFRSINTAIPLPQSENGHFLLNFRDVHGFLENEDTQDPPPTILNVAEDISAFLGDSETVPTLEELCQAEPRAGALHDEHMSAHKDADAPKILGDDAMVSSLGNFSQADTPGSAQDVDNDPDVEKENDLSTPSAQPDTNDPLPVDSENQQINSPCSKTLDCSGIGDFVNALDNALSAVSLRQIKQTTGPMLAEGLKKIHALWGHPSAAQLKKSLSHIEGLPNETNRVVERITKE